MVQFYFLSIHLYTGQYSDIPIVIRINSSHEGKKIGSRIPEKAKNF